MWSKIIKQNKQGALVAFCFIMIWFHLILSLIFGAANNRTESSIMTASLDALVRWITSVAPPDTFLAYQWNVYGLMAIILVGIVCGAVGSLVVGNRMAFFSDALAHCAFAGVAIGLFLGFITGAREEDFLRWLTPVMVAFGAALGLAIVFVRERTGQASDTVIAVFFAGAIGLGGIVLKAQSTRRYLPPEDFLFGNLATIHAEHIILLFVLVLCTGLTLAWLYNRLLLISFNPSLARSRGVDLRLCSCVFIVLLAVVVNVCLQVVGALLINALLIVPAATAAYHCSNMRQLFTVSMLLCVTVGVLGQWLSWEIAIPTGLPNGEVLHLGEAGVIVVLAVSLYLLSMLVPPLGIRKVQVAGAQQTGEQPLAPANHDHGSERTSR